jgi:FkbH-like protein
VYEPEVNTGTEPAESLPADVLARFAEYRERVTARTLLPWGEHCTECVWPVCYTTCALYDRRADGGCRQFVGSVVRIDQSEGLNPYILKVRFKQWAKFWAPGTLALKSLAKADRAERIHIAVGAIARATPLPGSIKTRVLGKVNYRRRLAAEQVRASAYPPDCFLLECFNPSECAVSLTLTLRRKDRNVVRRFEESIAVPAGFTRARIAFDGIARVVDVSQAFDVEIVPNGCENMTLYFGLMDFVKERTTVASSVSAPKKTTKCVVWDLDNTLWDGVLLEDGPRGVRLRDRVMNVIRTTDERGVMHSIASKNNEADVLPLLRKLGVDEYFLYPQIAWTPKSESIRRIANQLNIGLDSIAFVDDQAFEMEEVRAALPEVTVIDAARCEAIAQQPDFQAPATEEGRRRRQMYREQQQREAELGSYEGDYFGFLRACAIELAMQPLNEENLRRVYELAQRTNQMNFSGNRYEVEELRSILRREELSGVVIACRDRFGDYGIVGFAVVDTRQPCLIDLMFSCRVQAKRVEHAVLAFLLRRFAPNDTRDFFAKHRKTERNAAAGKVFDEMGFEAIGESDGVLSLVFRRGTALADDGIVTMVDELEAANA